MRYIQKIGQSNRFIAKITDLENERIERLLNSIYQSQGRGSRTVLRWTFALLRHPSISLAAALLIGSIPVVEVDISHADQKRPPWIYSRRQPWRLNGFVSSYIELPSPISLYWNGASKRNLRSRTAQAKSAGLDVRNVEASEIISIVSQVISDCGWHQNEKVTALREISEILGDAICVAVFDRSDRAIAFCMGTQAGNALRNYLSFSSQRGAARWLCFSGYVEEASGRGVTYIIESPPWAFTGGNRIFAGHLGFKPARIRGN